MSILRATRETKTIIAIVVIIAAIGFVIAAVYYGRINSSEDPRVTPAKYMFLRYDGFMKQNDYLNAQKTLDSIQEILVKTSGYDDSFELGIVFNNRSSVYISKALYNETDSIEKKLLLDSAYFYALKAINLYTTWIDSVKGLNQNELKSIITKQFNPNDSSFKGLNCTRIIDKRVKDLVLARDEVPRRLSVAFTNLGIIQRHQLHQSEAAESYVKALQLWEDNPAALSNLNVLFGKPPKDRTILQKLFPPDRYK